MSDRNMLEKHNYTMLLQEKHETTDAILKAQIMKTKMSKDHALMVENLICIAERHLMDVRRKLEEFRK